MKYEFDLKKIIFEISSERKPTNREIVEYDKFKAFEEKFCKKLSAQQKEEYERLQHVWDVYEIENEKALIGWIVDFLREVNV